MSFLNEKKIKPYAVVDLSAHTILSSDEIEQCLQEASHKQRLKFVGDYAYNGNHAKENGDAPNFIAIPPKKRSKSLSALYDELLKSEEEKNIRKSSDNTGTMCQNAYSQITPTTTTPSGYDVITGRERSYTAPATVYDVVRIKSSRRRKTSKASRIATPSSPGVAKRKVQQKLQQQQRAGASKLVAPTTGASKLVAPSSTTKMSTTTQPGQKTPSMLPKQSGLRAPSAPSASGMRQPSARAPSSTHETPKPSGLKPPGETGNATPRNSNNNNTIAKQPQSIQRSTLPRMSKKNSDTHSSSPDSSSGSEGGQRSAPASALSMQSPRPLASKPPLAGIPQPKSAVKTRSPNATAGNESKEQLQRMKREKSADCLRTKREKSSECIRKISTPGNLSVGNSRLKKSSENLSSYSRESTAENLKKEGSPRSKESGIATPRDTKESGITPPRPGMIKMNSSSGLKKPSGLVGPRKISAPAAPNESKMKPPASGLSRPSGIGKPSGLAKPSGIAKANSTASRDNLSNKLLTKDDDKVNTNSTENVSKLTPPKEQVSKISPPKQSKEQPSKIASSKEQASRIASPVTSRKLASPSTPRRMASPSTPRKIPLPNGPTRRASDGTLGLQTKSRLEVNAAQKKKLSDLSTHEESINEITERNETRELKYPIVGGKLPDRLGDTNRFINKSLKFQPNPKLTKPTKPTEKESTEEPTVSDIETPTNENLVAPPEEFVGESVERDDAAGELSIANDFVASETSTLGEDGNIISNILGDDEQREPTDTEEDTEIEESENEDIRFPKNSISSLPEKDPFAEFDTSFDTSQLTGIDQHFDTSKLTGIDDYEPTETTFTKLKQRPISESDSDIDSDHPKSVYDESEIPKADYTNLGYTEPDDSIKRSEQLSSDSGYIEPLDTPSSSRNSLPYRKQSGSNASSVPDDISSNESNPSPRFGEENDQAGSPSHFKRVQPKVLIPPPRINSYTEDLLAPLPKDYMRTPSSDMEEIHLVQSHAEVELRRKVREQAFKVWGKKHAQKDTVTESDENEEHLLDGDYNDVFYTKEMEQKSNTLERYAHRTSLRRESDDESRLSMEKNLRQLETMTLDRKEKKTSKIKKFFKKLSNKKDAAKYDQEFSSRNDRLPSTDSEHSTQHISNSTGYDLKSRRRSDGSCPDGYGNRSNSLSSSSKASNEDYPPSTKHHDLVFKNKRHSLTSDDSMIMSSESLSSSQGHGNNEVFDRQHSARKSNTRADSSLRKTPLRNSIDSYNRLLEVHRHTIDKIAFEVSRLVCTCQQLQTTDWNNYERSDDVIQLGVPGYMVVPVTCAKSEQKNYTAWLRINEGNEIQSASSSNLTTTTLHRNCLHICHVIEPTSPTPTNEQPSKSIESNRAFISTQLPKMPLSKYVSSTIEKHTRYPEIYERETALILLQVVKGVLHLVRKRAPIKTVNAENIFILNTGGSDPTAVISPTQQSPKCPSVVVGCLPGIGDQSVSTSSTDVITNLCHQMAFLLYELLHSSFEEELKLIVNSPMLFTTLPDLTIKSIYSRYLQSIIDKLLGTPQHTINSLDELRLTLEVILFGPTDICDHEEKEALDLIKKWHNRRCVDMVTYILKEAPLIMLCASEHHGQEVEKIKRVDQEILLECEFLSSIMPVDIYRVSKELRR